MVNVGRRPGNPETREEIVVAARATFAEHGYVDATIRGIARRAGVDPALVHHYFENKADLFMAVAGLRHDPRQTVDAVQEAADRGETLIRGFLASFEPQQDSPFLVTAQAVSASPEVADAMREFLAERVWSRIPAHERGAPQALITAQLWGLAYVRYVLRVEPLATASIDQIVDWVAPHLNTLLRGPTPDATPKPRPHTARNKRMT
jgi:AcrR family transcriptional regulator